MKFWFIVGLLTSALAAHSAVLSDKVTSVELSPGLAYSENNSKIFSSLTDAQKFATANNLNEITLRIHMSLNESDCQFKLPALFFGYVYDQDRAVFNGQVIGSTGNPELSKRRLSLIPRVYPIPAQILNCPGKNQMDLSLRRILGGWIGPFAGSIELGELHELQERATVIEARGPLLQRDIGILLLAISVLLISLFYRYPDNNRQSAFAVFSLSTALLCLSLSGWYYRFFDFPEVIFRLHFAFISLALTTQILFVAAYRGFDWTKKVSKPLFFVGSFLIFTGESFAIGTVETLLNIYLFQLLVLILGSMIFYLWPLLAPRKFGYRRDLNYGIEVSLFLIHLGSSMDIARIWKLHSFENISPYTYGLSIFIIGSILASELVQVFQKAAQTAEAEALLKQSERQAEFARQVGHDIRSPLAALNMIVRLLKGIPEEQRLVVRNSAQRINDIANSLLDPSWSKLRALPQASNSSLTLATTGQCIMMSSLIDSIVSEKRVQYRERHEIDIEVDLSASYGLFSNIDPNNFGRSLSNLIDNSVEAFGTSPGRILVTIDSDDSFNRIIVADNGRGISSEFIGQLGLRGASFGKKSGSGLGLYQAKTTVESIGGSLAISSVAGEGTSIVLAVPKADPPSWFISHLTISSESHLISVDDDQTVHQIWGSRLQNISGNRPKHLAFTSIAQFENWYRKNSTQSSRFLVDFEFLGHAENGLQVISRLNLANRAILVSSRVEDHQIQARALDLGLKLLPKALAALIPIEITGT